MVVRPLPVDRQVIERAVERIAALFAPAAVILFGSYAYGEPTPDSDVDLLVTMETPLRPVDQAVEIRSKVSFPFPLDLIVRTPAQVAERVRIGDPFFREILDKGITLYEATDGGVDRQSRERPAGGRNALE
ncbi:MAG: nucleotidyltransferase domain-containing protein [Dehalococcoidia bacterium]